MNCSTCKINKSNPKQKIIAWLILFLYFLGSCYHFFQHGKKHVHDEITKHHQEIEKNVCHQSTAHFNIKGNVCHHQKHFNAQEKKCKDCEFYSTIDIEEKFVFDFIANFYFSTSTFYSHQFYFLFYNKEYLGRAPPVFLS